MSHNGVVMSTGALAKITAKSAAEVCKLFELGDELGDDAKKLLKEGVGPKPFLDQLVQKQQFADAVRFLAHALPKREAVWWACVCIRAAGANLPPKLGEALQAAEKWVADPKEENRRAAEKAGREAGLKTPAGCAALAAFYSGGSLGPADAPPIPPAEHLTARAATGAVMLAAVADPARIVERQKLFLAKGVEVGNGTNRWKEK